MPKITRVFLRTALVFFVLGLSLLLAATVAGMPWAMLLLPTYLHYFTVGFMTFMIAGVALWMFPRWTKEAPRGPEWLGWLCYGLLTVGLALRGIAEPTGALGWLSMNAVVVFSAVLQWMGGLILVGLLWPRIKEKG